MLQIIKKSMKLGMKKASVYLIEMKEPQNKKKGKDG